MSRRARIRQQRPVYVNAVQIAISRAQRLSDSDVAGQAALMQHALVELIAGANCSTHWRSLADTANMAETLAAMGLGCGPDADQIIEQGQQALADAWRRHAERSTWTLYPAEIEALRWLVRLHCHTQLPACSYGELETALERTGNRIAQARAGNAAPGTVVLAGNCHPCSTEDTPHEMQHPGRDGHQRPAARSAQGADRHREVAAGRAPAT